MNSYVLSRVETAKNLQDYQFRLLSLALDTQQDPQQREFVLRYLVATLEGDNQMKAWAEEQLEGFDRVLTLTDELEAKDRALAEAAREEQTRNTQFAVIDKERLALIDRLDGSSAA